MNDFRTLLKYARLNRKISQVDFARDLGITPKHLNLIENCNVFPSWPLFFEMAQKLDYEMTLIRRKRRLTKDGKRL